MASPGMVVRAIRNGEKLMSGFTILTNRSSVHIQGLEEATTSSGTEKDGVVGNYAASTCSALSRHARFERRGTFDDLAEVLKRAQSTAITSNRKLSKNCERRATQLLEQIAKPSSINKEE